MLNTSLIDLFLSEDRQKDTLQPFSSIKKISSDHFSTQIVNLAGDKLKLNSLIKDQKIRTKQQPQQPQATTCKPYATITTTTTKTSKHHCKSGPAFSHLWIACLSRREEPATKDATHQRGIHLAIRHKTGQRIATTSSCVFFAHKFQNTPSKRRPLTIPIFWPQTSWNGPGALQERRSRGPSRWDPPRPWWPRRAVEPQRAPSEAKFW